MLETLRERKAALEAQGKKGFTLMEMLIVIAIIAILIAIAIPVFTAQLQKAELETDAANVRSAYSEAVAQAIVNGTGSDGKVSVEFTDPSTHSKAEVKSGESKITVTHKSNNSLNETFDFDSDVTVKINPATTS